MSGKKTKKIVIHKPTPAGPGVPLTAFNFVEDAYQKRRADRRNIRIASGAFGLIWVVLIVVGFLAGSAVSGNKQAALDAESAAQKVETGLAEALGGVPDLAGHLADRRAEIDTALSNDLTAQALVSDLFATTPADVRIVSIELLVPGARPADPSAPPTTVATTTTVPGTPAPALGAKLTVVGEGSRYASAAEWRTAAQNLPYASGVLVDYSTDSGAGGIQMTLTATIDLTVLQARRQAAAAELGFTPAPPTTAPAATAAPEGGH